MVDGHLSDGTATAVVILDMMEILIIVIQDPQTCHKQTLAEDSTLYIKIEYYGTD